MSEIWTIKRLNEISDLDFIETILNERRNKLTNVYAPLSQKIGEVIGKINRRNIFQCPSGKAFNEKTGRCIVRK